ncbi:MAG: type II toxin-antitoxin system VapC family toxin [Patulibacter sp.]|nr:type II toxin-antitoxin system VapC family toxin [Patulibacter sp.]
MIYLDSSAILKLVFDEAESAALAEWFGPTGSTVPPVSSELARIEVLRGCRRVDPRTLPAARTLLAGLDLIPISADVVDLATEIGDGLLRSLDAIHLASAAGMGDELTRFVTYDHRLAGAAVTEGLAVASPGVSGG